MPRSFLITNKRYRNELVHAVAQPHLAASQVSSVDFRSIQNVIGISHEHKATEERKVEYSRRASQQTTIDNGPVIETSLAATGEEEEAMVQLYQGMNECRLHLAFLPELFLSNHVPSTDLSPLSPKSVFYGSDSDRSVDHVGYNKRESNSSVSDAVHACPDCGKAYSTTSNLARHRQTHRSTDDKKARKCPHCDKLYVSSPAYSMHVRTHNQGCACSHCGKRFSRPWLLQGHIRTHTGEKPFECPKCGKTFADKSNLRAHIQTHSSEKPFVCGRCGKGFALKSYLYKHEESSCMRSHRLYHQTSFHPRYHHAIANTEEVF